MTIHISNKQILNNLYTEYQLLPWYKKIFFPRSIKATVTHYHNEDENPANIWRIFEAVVNNNSWFFRNSFFSCISRFSSSLLFKSLTFLNNVGLDLYQNNNLDLEEGNCINLQDILDYEDIYIFDVLTKLHNENLFSRDSGAAHFNFVKGSFDTHLSSLIKIIKILQHNNITINSSNTLFEGIKTNLHVIIISDILDKLNTVDLITPENVNLILNHNGLFALDEAITIASNIYLPEFEERQVLLTSLIDEKSLWEIIANHPNVTIIADIFNKLHSLNLITFDNINRLINYTSLYSLAEAINALSVNSFLDATQKQIVLSNLFEDEAYLKAILIIVKNNIQLDNFYETLQQENVCEAVIALNNLYATYEVAKDEQLAVFMDKVQLKPEFASAIIKLNEYGLLNKTYFDVLKEISENQSPIEFAQALHELNQAGLLNNNSTLKNINALKMGANPILIAKALITLDENGLLHGEGEDENRNIVARHEYPETIAYRLCKLSSFGLLTGPNADANRVAFVNKHTNYSTIFSNLKSLADLNLMQPGMSQGSFDALVGHENPEAVYNALVFLKNSGLTELGELEANRRAVAGHPDPEGVAYALIDLKNNNLLNNITRNIVANPRNPRPDTRAVTLIMLNKVNLLTNNNINALMSYEWDLSIPVDALKDVDLLFGDIGQANFDKLIHHDFPKSISESIFQIACQHGNEALFTRNTAQRNFDAIIAHPAPQFMCEAIIMLSTAGLFKGELGQEYFEVITDPNVENPVSVATRILENNKKNRNAGTTLQSINDLSVGEHKENQTSKDVVAETITSPSSSSQRFFSEEVESETPESNTSHLNQSL